jgi:hypothetical protein
MFRLILLPGFIFCSSFFSEPLSFSEDKTSLISGATHKQWFLYSKAPDEAGSCISSAPLSRDNTYTFYANGTFEFDHGAITEDATCQGEDCCTDFVNLTGTWRFTNSQKGLRIIALHETGNTANAQKIVLYNGTIEYLDESVLKFSQSDPSTNIKYTFEFRKR